MSLPISHALNNSCLRQTLRVIILHAVLMKTRSYLSRVESLKDSVSKCSNLDDSTLRSDEKQQNAIEHHRKPMGMESVQETPREREREREKLATFLMANTRPIDKLTKHRVTCCEHLNGRKSERDKKKKIHSTNFLIKIKWNTVFFFSRI